MITVRVLSPEACECFLQKKKVGYPSFSAQATLYLFRPEYVSPLVDPESALVGSFLSDCVSDVGFAHSIRVVRTMLYQNQASTYDAGNVHPNCSNLALVPGGLGNSPNAISYVGSVFKLIITSDYSGTSMLYEPSLTSCTVYWRTTLLKPGPIISC